MSRKLILASLSFNFEPETKRIDMVLSQHICLNVFKTLDKFVGCLSCTTNLWANLFGIHENFAHFVLSKCCSICYTVVPCLLLKPQM